MRNLPDFSGWLEQPDYAFLHEDARLRGRVMLLGLAGSYGYGTWHEGSDVDLRGVALQRPSDLLGLTSFEQYVDDRGTDTVIYGFNKLVRLLLDANPSACELLGLPEENYLILTPLGRELRSNRRLFLSQRVIRSFGGYAVDQLRRLQNAIARDSLSQQEREAHILQSVERTMEEFNRRHSDLRRGSMRLYIDRAETPGLDAEIFLDAQCEHLPLRTYTSLLETMQRVLRDYSRAKGRNGKKDAEHLNKHAMHLIRLLLTAAELLETGDIVTCRTEELPLLMEIRQGGMMQADGAMSPAFYEVLAACERRMQEAARHTKLPEEPDLAAVEALMEKINRHAIEEGVAR